MLVALRHHWVALQYLMLVPECREVCEGVHVCVGGGKGGEGRGRECEEPHGLQRAWGEEAEICNCLQQ